MCPKIKSHVHYEGRVYWLGPDEDKKEFINYGSPKKNNSNNKSV